MTNAQRKLESRRTRLAIIVFVIIATCLGTFATVQTARINAHVAKVATCNQTYNNAAQASSSIRAKLNQEQIDATTTVIVGVATATTKLDVEQALAHFLAVQTTIAKEKADNPVPPPLKDLCK